MSRIFNFQKWYVPPQVIHLLVWLLVYLFPMIMIQEHDSSWQVRYWTTIPFFTIVASFYANYSFLIPKFLFSKKYIQYIAINAIIFVIFIFILNTWRDYISSIGMLRHDMDREMHHSLIKGLATFIFINGIAISTYSATMWFRSKEIINKLELENIHAKLSSLKMQISPHFLFNTLNNILVLIDENSELAKQSVQQLSKLLRSMLYEFEKDSITINQEVQFLKNYSDLMILRYGSGLKFNFETDLSEPDTPIAPLLLIPLLENVFKHGVGPSLENSSIDVKIISKNGKITFESSNTYFPKTNQDKSGSGIGVDNTKKRLAMLYENRYYYDCKIDGENYIIKLELKT